MPKTLLLADDSVTIQKVVGITFANEDVELVTVDNGDDALIRARQMKPDLVLADIGMPGLDGYETCRRLRAEPWGAELFLIAVTGWGQEEDRRRSEEAGFDHHLVKPVDPEALAVLVSERVR